MTRGLFLIVMVIYGVLLLFDVRVAAIRIGQQGLPPVSWLHVAAALMLQVFSVWLAYPYIAFMRRNWQLYGLHFSEPVSLRLKLFPFVVPGLLAVCSVLVLHKSVLCSDQPLFPVFGVKEVCSAEHPRSPV